MILALKAADRTTQAWLIAPKVKPAAVPELDWESGRQLSDELLARLLELLAAHGLTPADLTGCIVFSGPGSFTSLRIGHATINALADGLSIPVVGAGGEHWLNDGLAALTAGKPGLPALPDYGGEAHITPPKNQPPHSKA